MLRSRYALSLPPSLPPSHPPSLAPGGQGNRQDPRYLCWQERQTSPFLPALPPSFQVGKDIVKTQAVSASKGEATYAFGGETVALLVKGNLAAEKVTIYLRQHRMSGTRLLGKVRKEGGGEGGREGRIRLSTSLPCSTHTPSLPSLPPFLPPSLPPSFPPSGLRPYRRYCELAQQYHHGDFRPGGR